MRYIKKESGQIFEYSGVNLGGDLWYERLGWTPYSGTLPVAQLDIVEGAVVELPPPPSPPVLISKLKLKRKLEELGAWAEFKNAMDAAGYMEDFNLAVNLSTGDAEFQNALTAFAGLAPDVDALIADCVWEG